MTGQRCTSILGSRRHDQAQGAHLKRAAELSEEPGPPLLTNTGKALQLGEPSTIRRMPGYPKVNRLSFIIFLAFMLFRNVDGGNRVEWLGAIRFEFLLGGTAVAMAIAKMTVQRVQLRGSQNILVLLGLLLVTMIIQVPFAADPFSAQTVFTNRAYKFAFLTFLIVSLVESPTAMRAFVGVFLYSIFHITFEAFLGLVTGQLVWENQGVMRLHGSVPMYGHPNSLSGWAMSALPFVVFLFVPVQRWLPRLGLLLVAFASLVCVLYSGSRTAYIGLISLILWWFILSQRKLRFLIVASIVCVIALPFVPDQYAGRFKSIAGHEAEGASKASRIEVLKDALIIFSENPLGIGVSSFPAVRASRFGREAVDTHNLYLEVATNLGIQGFAAFVGLVWSMMASFRNSARAFRAQSARLNRLVRNKGLPPGVPKQIRKHSRDLAFCLSMAQATAGFVVVRLALGFFGMDLYEIYWWVGAGVAVSLAGLVVTTNRKTQFFEQLVVLENEHALE